MSSFLDTNIVNYILSFYDRTWLLNRTFRRQYETFYRNTILKLFECQDPDNKDTVTFERTFRNAVYCMKNYRYAPLHVFEQILNQCRYALHMDYDRFTERFKDFVYPNAYEFLVRRSTHEEHEYRIVYRR